MVTTTALSEPAAWFPGPAYAPKANPLGEALAGSMTCTTDGMFMNMAYGWRFGPVEQRWSSCLAGSGSLIGWLLDSDPSIR